MTITPERLAELRVVAGNFPRGQNLSESESNYNYELFLDTFSPRTVMEDLIDLLAEKDDNDKAHGVMIRELQRLNAELGVDNLSLRDRLAAVKQALGPADNDWRWNDTGLRRTIRAALAEGGVK